MGYVNNVSKGDVLATVQVRDGFLLNIFLNYLVILTVFVKLWSVGYLYRDNVHS